MEGVSKAIQNQVCVPGGIHGYINVYVCWVRVGIEQVWAVLSTQTCLRCVTSF